MAKPKTIRQKLEKIKLPKGAQKASFPRFEPPMLATLHDKAFSDENWIYELKWDGYRALAYLHNGDVKLYSRNGNIFYKYGEINEEFEKFPFDAVLDGEIVALNNENYPSFQRLQNFDSNPHTPLYFYVFDILYFNGYDLTNVSLINRKKFLEEILPPSMVVTYSEHFEEAGEQMYDFAMQKGLEGIMAKKAQSLYYPGKRSNEWLKIKVQQTQEGIVVGFTEPKGSRNYFGSLLLAANHRGKLKYIGSSGGGFTQKKLKELYELLQQYEVEKPVITEKIPYKKSEIHWVEPQIVIEVAFSEWTDEGTMRHPVFRGMRLDKFVKDVVIEKPKS